MKRRAPVFLLTVFALSLAVHVFAVSPREAVPVMPNQAMLEGEVTGYCIASSGSLDISPEMEIYAIAVTVEKSEPVSGFVNFLSGKEGQSVTLYSKEKVQTGVFGKKIRASVEFMGDERGGKFWIKTIEKVIE